MFHNSIHVQLRQFAGEVRKQDLVFKDKILSTEQPMGDSESHDQKGYIAQANNPTSLYSNETTIQKDISGLRDQHVNLTKFRTHMQGIDHNTAKQSRRSMKNMTSTATFEEAIQAIRQHDETISDAIKRRAHNGIAVEESAQKLNRSIDAVNLDASFDHST